MSRLAVSVLRKYDSGIELCAGADQVFTAGHKGFVFPAFGFRMQERRRDIALQAVVPAV